MKNTKNENTKIVPFFSVDIPFDIVYRKSSTSTPVKPHTHNGLEIYFTLTDLPDVLLNSTVSSVSQGSLIVIPPHCVHQLFNQKLTVYERYIITISNNWLSNVLAGDNQLMPYAVSSASPHIITLPANKTAYLKKYLDTYINAEAPNGMSKYSDFFSSLNVLDSYITEGLNSKASKKLNISQSQKKVNEIILYINDHITEPLTMDTIADTFHLNKDYLGRLFKEHTQATVGHYISVQRAGLAQSLLAEGHSVSEVQEALGFSSYSYFFKFFKKMTGDSPSHYRKKESNTI